MKPLRRFHGNHVGARTTAVYVCKVCGGWQVDARGNPLKKPDFFCSDHPCNGTEFHYFMSQTEARGYAALKLRERVGEIADIELQPPFDLHVRSPDGRPIKIGRYIADYRYREIAENRVCVVDAKGGADTHMSAWKRKHAEAEYGIKIQITQP